MNKHTAGPWKATILDSYGRFEIAPQDGGRCIAKPGSGWGDASRAEEQEANARLIAAAPDLLLVAVMAKAYMEQRKFGHGIEDPLWHAAKDAIAKVEGRA